MNQHWKLTLVAVIAAAFLNLPLSENAAGQTMPRSELKTITLGLISNIHQKEIATHFSDFIDYVARKLAPGADVKAKVVVASNVVSLAKMLEQKEVDFYLESPYPTYIINNVHGAGRLLLRRWKSGMSEYRSLIFTKKDGSLSRLQDLRGKIIAFEDPESTSGYFLPKFFLQRNGFKLVEKTPANVAVGAGEIGYVFASSLDSLIESVLSGKVAAATFSDDDFASLAASKKAGLTILAQTELLPRHLVSVRKDLAAEWVERLGLVLLGMNEDDQGRKIMLQADNTTKFDPLPGGEEVMRRRLLETFHSPDKR
jgi:phosphonate transport system substrate-binding protein